MVIEMIKIGEDLFFDETGRDIKISNNTTHEITFNRQIGRELVTDLDIALNSLNENEIPPRRKYVSAGIRIKVDDSFVFVENDMVGDLYAFLLPWTSEPPSKL